MIARINHESQDEKLRTEIEKFNQELAVHNTSLEAFDKPPEIDGGDMLTITAKQLTSMHSKSLEGRLRVRQQAVVLARKWVELLEAIAPELRQLRDDADQALKTSLEVTAEHMEAVGLGVESTVAGRAGRADGLTAQRQFDYQVRQAVPVKISEQAVKTSQNVVSGNLKQVGAAKSLLQDARDRLITFVNQSLKG